MIKEGRVRDLKVPSSANMNDIEHEIRSIFSAEGEVTYYRADRANCLAKADPPETVDELLQFVGHGSLYITIIKSPAKSDIKSSSIAFDPKKVEDQLHDPLIGQLWLEQAGLAETNCDLDEVRINFYHHLCDALS